MGYTYVAIVLEDPLSAPVVSAARNAQNYGEFLAAVLDIVCHLRTHYPRVTPYLCHILSAVTRKQGTDTTVQRYASYLRSRIQEDLEAQYGPHRFCSLPDALWLRYPNADHVSPYAIRIAYLEDLIKEENRGRLLSSATPSH